MFRADDIADVYSAETGADVAGETTRARHLEYGRWLPSGNQVRAVRRPKKDAPEWACSREALLVRAVGPAAMKRFQVAYLYWFCNWNTREVGAELGMSANAVEQVIHRLKG